MTIPEDVEEYRDRRWWREETRCVQTPADAERFVDHVGFAACLTDARRPGPSLYIAVCGRRDAMLPRTPQKDPEASLTWRLKDELLRRGNVYYAKLARGRSLFVAPRLIPHFHAIWGQPLSAAGERQSGARRRSSDAPPPLSSAARAILKVLRREWEMATSDLRKASRLSDRATFQRGLDELQAAMLVIPSDVVYQPFTYIWTLAIGRFPDALRQRTRREVALREIARAFLAGAGTTYRGELARVSGLSRPDAGLGHHALVAEGVAERVATGVYRFTRIADA